MGAGACRGRGWPADPAAGSGRLWDWFPDSRGRRPQGQSGDWAGLPRGWLRRESQGALTEPGWAWGRGLGCPLWDDISARPDRGRMSARPEWGRICVCARALRAPAARGGRCLPSDALSGRHLVSVRPAGGDICASSRQGTALCAGTRADSSALPAPTWAEPPALTGGGPRSSVAFMIIVGGARGRKWRCLVL